MKNYQSLGKSYDGKSLNLENYEEIVGTLNKIRFHEKHGFVTLVFTFQEEINLPMNACSKNILVNNIGKKIGIINIENNYKIRIVKVWLFIKIRTEAKIIRYPDRYTDSRGETMWNNIWDVINDVCQKEKKC